MHLRYSSAPLVIVIIYYYYYLLLLLLLFIIIIIYYLLFIIIITVLLLLLTQCACARVLQYSVCQSVSYSVTQQKADLKDGQPPED